MSANGWRVVIINGVCGGIIVSALPKDWWGLVACIAMIVLIVNSMLDD